MGYEGLRGVVDPEVPELGGNVHNGDPFSFAPSVWRYLVHRFGIKSVLDVGCGQGHAAFYFSSVLGCAVIAMDGLEENLNGSVYPVVVHDLRVGPLKTRVDLVHCVEVVEHLEEKYLPHMLKTFEGGRVLAMTHAVPGQDGHHHVNCRSSDYWRTQLSAHGFSLAEEDTTRIRALAAKDGAQHFAKSGLIFAKL
jgi:SAM-dependent methyltransferase